MRRGPPAYTFACSRWNSRVARFRAGLDAAPNRVLRRGIRAGGVERQCGAEGARSLVENPSDFAAVELGQPTDRRAPPIPRPRYAQISPVRAVNASGSRLAHATCNKPARRLGASSPWLPDSGRSISVAFSAALSYRAHKRTAFCLRNHPQSPDGEP